MSKPTLILIGAGEHANACIDVLEQQGQFQIAGLVGLPSELYSRRLGHSVIANDADLPLLAKDNHFAIVTAGQIEAPDLRMRLWAAIIKYRFQLPIIVSPSAYVSPHATVGAGSIVMHGAIVNNGAKIGRNCIVNSQSLVEHDAVVEDHCHVSTGAILNGRVRIGLGSFIGSGAVIKDGVAIGDYCVVGMGLAVRHNLPPHSRFAGTPRP